MSTQPPLSNPAPSNAPVFGIIGWKNSGKTTMVVELVRFFRRHNVRVGTVKHAHHNVDIDQPGKDSWRHRDAGAEAVLLATGKRMMLVQEWGPEPEPPLADLLERMPTVDLILVEGFKRDRHLKVEVSRAATGADLIARDDPSVVAVASDYAPAGLDLQRYDLNDIAGIAAFIGKQTGLAARLAR